jgi:hypothetical protein
MSEYVENEDNDQVECLRYDLGNEILVSSVHAVLALLRAALVGFICTWLVYWTVRQHTVKNQRHVIAGQVDEQQRKRSTRAVGMQAVWYMAAFLNGLLWATLFGCCNHQ